MLASLRNIDYPPNKIKLVVAVTDRGDSESNRFTIEVINLMDNAMLDFSFEILKVKSSKEDMERWGQYYAVIMNLHRVRKIFLDAPEFQYLWLLGGDNPPPRSALKRLLALKADVASGIINQRPNRDRFENKGGQVYPVFWEYVWTMRDLEKRKDLEPQLKEELRRAWIQIAFMLLAKGKLKTVYRGVNFGSGCSLIKRKVLEYAGYYLGAGYHSEDIHFLQYVNAMGFKTALDTGIHIPHFDPNGDIY